MLQVNINVSFPEESYRDRQKAQGTTVTKPTETTQTTNNDTRYILIGDNQQRIAPNLK